MPDLLIDERRRSVYLDGQEIQLTPQEYRLLYCLGRNGGQVVTKADLLAAMWSTPAGAQSEASPYDPAAVDLVVFRLRQKLGDRAHQPTYIETRRGFGYILHGAQIVRSAMPASPGQSEQSSAPTTGALSGGPSTSEHGGESAMGRRAWSTLTRREWELFLLLGDEQATRLTNRALAQQLQMAEGTLKKHLQHIYRKLEVENRASAALLAMQVKLHFAKEQA